MCIVPSKQLTNLSALQEVQAAHLRVMTGRTKGRSLLSLFGLVRQPMSVVQTWLQVNPLSFCKSCPVTCCNSNRTCD